jgi:hypothetical protein
MDVVEPLFEIDPHKEVERQIDAMFAPAFSLIPERHHNLLIRLEQDMISAVKSALRLPAIQPARPDPSHWPFGSGTRLSVFLTPAQRTALRDIKDTREN